MKKEVLFGIFILFILSINLAIADETTDKVDKAYECLMAKVNESCASLSTEEKAFSLLSVGECKSELLDDSSDENCWPSSSCNLKTTAQALLALENSGSNTDDIVKWLTSQNTTPSNMEWYLEIESSNPTTCTITYDNSAYSVEINSDKKINSPAGNCLSLSQDPYQDYWLNVASSCYNKEFSVSCNESFLTTFLYKKSDSPIIYVSPEIESASSGGTVTEEINFMCFKQGNICNYEGSLWSAFVLNSLGKDISSYLPYLITSAEDYSDLFPEAFLYSLTEDSNYRVSTLSKQINAKWWDVSGDKYYDTSIALLPFQTEELNEKTNAKAWLLENQDTQGCWQGNVRNTAFLLYSIWPKLLGTVTVDSGIEDCSDVGGYCIYEDTCSEAGGSELGTYTPFCDGTKICCDSSPLTTQTCSEAGGEICSSDEICSDNVFETSDTYECCSGYCSTSVSESECSSEGGTCRSSCLSDSEDETNYDCDYIGEVCCVPVVRTGASSSSEGGSYTWIWILLVLIILVVLGIIFREKLRPLWLRIKSKFHKKTPPTSPMSSALTKRPPTRQIPRRILPPSQRPPIRKSPPKKRSSELDDVLKKLKEIGK